MTVNDNKAYPLSWPMGWPRTKNYSVRRSEFGAHSMADASAEILRQVKLLGGRAVVISTNIELRQDGLPYSNRRQPNDAGAAVYFMLNSKPLVLACDKWRTVEDNLWAIAKHIDALRGQQRWGVGSIEQAFAGYTALPPANGSSAINWWSVLGVAAHAPTEDIKAAYRALVKVHHPDAGGSAEKFVVVQKAYDAAKAERNFA